MYSTLACIAFQACIVSSFLYSVLCCIVYYFVFYISCIAFWFYRICFLCSILYNVVSYGSLKNYIYGKKSKTKICNIGIPINPLDPIYCICSICSIYSICSICSNTYTNIYTNICTNIYTNAIDYKGGAATKDRRPPL